MNNDLSNNHSSVSSNRYIANRKYPQLNKYIQESYIKDKNKGMLDIQSKGNKTIFFDSDNDKRPSNQKELLISKAESKYPANYAPGPNPYNDGIIQGYYINVKDESRYNKPTTYQIPLRQRINERIEERPPINNYYYRRNVENGGEDVEEEEINEGEYEDEMEMENGKNYVDISPQKEAGYYNDYNEYIGDGIVRNNIPNFSPNQNGQNVRYYKKANIPNLNNKYNNFGQDNENEEDQYEIESPAKNYNINRQPYRRRHILGNLGDSASSEAYASSNTNQRNPNTENYSKIYVKPKTKYTNNNNNINVNGISTEERGIESQRQSPNNAANNGSYLRKPYHYIDTEENELNKYKHNKINNYDEDSINVIEPPLYNYPNNDINKGGKVDLNNFGILKNRTKRGEDEDEERGELEDEYEINEEKIIRIIKLQRYVKSYIKVKEEKVTKIQSLWRGRGTRKIMKLYHDLEEFIFLISIVNFNHFSDNFFFFINQLFNVYKAKTLDNNNQIDSLDEEKEDNKNEQNEPKEEEEEEEKIDENNKDNKKYNKLLNEYNILQEKYNELVYTKNNLSSAKKSVLNNNNDILSVPGETTIGTIKTDTHKFPKFRGTQTNNNSTSIINNENITFSNDYNDDTVNNREYDRHFYTPNQEDEDSFNEGSKEKRFSYSSIHSEENSKYFDNEQPGRGTTSGKRNISLKNKGIKNKIGLLSLNKKKDRLLSYSPSSRGNSITKQIQNDSQNENRVNNIAIVPKHEDEFEISPMDEDKNLLNNDIIDPKKLEENIYDKYANNFSKDLRIVKNNKINLENDNDQKLYCFDNERMFPENENNLELVAPKKTDDQKIKDIFDNERLLEKMKDKIKDIIIPEKKELTQYNGDAFLIENEKSLDEYISENTKKINNEIEQNINNLEILQNDHRNFAQSKLDLESNELFLGNQINLLKKKNLKKIIPTFENELNFERTKDIPNKNPALFSEEKTLPTFNDAEEKNAFTIKNKTPKREPKSAGFPKDKMIVDNVYNSEFSLIEDRPMTERGMPSEKQKDIVYLPFKENVFKRLRRSKRTKDTYFTIKSEPKEIIDEQQNNLLRGKKNKKDNKNKDILKVNENNFEIKSEYYYVETKDTPTPEIIEKEIKETIIINQPGENGGKFSDDKIILSNEDNFDIQANKTKNKYLEDIETNELTILSEINNKKRKKGTSKQWDNLNPIANDEFSYRNDYEYESNKESENNEPIDHNKSNEKYYEDKNDNYENISFDIQVNEQFEIIDPKKYEQIDLIESRENDINLDGDDIPKEDKEAQIDIRPVKITTKKIVRKESILSRKKFLNNQSTLEDSFSIYGTTRRRIRNYYDKLYKQPKEDRNINDKKEIILKEVKNCQLNYKKLRKVLKDNETETEADLIKEFNNIEHMPNDEFVIKSRKTKTQDAGTEITEELNNEDINDKNSKKELPLEINNENVLIKGKKKKMIESETEIDNEINKFEPYANDEIMYSSDKPKVDNIISKGDILNIYAPEKELESDKKEIVLEPTNIDNIHLESRNRAFPRLDMNKCLYQTFNGKEKEKNEYVIENNEMFIQSDENKSDKNELPKEKEPIKTFNELDINKCDEYNILGKEEVKEKEKEKKKERKKNKMIESETQIDEDLLNIIPEKNNELIYEPSESLKEDNLSKLRGQRKGKDENIPYDIESQQLLIEGSKNEEDKKGANKFSNLELDKCEDEMFNGKEKEILLEFIKNEPIELNGIDKEELLEYIKNESFGLNGKEKVKEILEKIKNEPIILEGEEKEKIIEYIKNESFGLNGKEKEKEIFESIQNEPIILNGKEKEKDNLEYIKNDSIIFTGKEKEKEVSDQDNLNKEFNKDTLELCHSENLAIIIKEDYERKEEEKKKDSNNDNQNENASPQKNNLVESVERIEITGKEKDNENEEEGEGEEEEPDEDEDEYPTGKNKRKTKQIINNMVQDKLKKEKQKNMEKTKENVIKVFKVIKLKNALGKNLKNKRYFIEKLKELKNINDKKNRLCPVTAITHDFISKKNRKREKGTDVDDLDETNKNVIKKDDKPLDIDNNNQIELIGDENEKKNMLDFNEETNDQFSIYQKKKKLNENETEITDELNKMKPVSNNKFSIIVKKKLNENETEITDELNKMKPVSNNKFSIIVKKKLNENETEITDELNKIKPVSNNKFSIIVKKKINDNEENAEPKRSQMVPEDEEGQKDLNNDEANEELVETEGQTGKKKRKVTIVKIKKKVGKKPFKNLKSINTNSFSVIDPESVKEEKDKLNSQKKEKVTTCDVMTQTPKLRPPNKAPKKVVFHEIKTIIKKEPNPVNSYGMYRTANIKFIGNGKKEKPKRKIKDIINEEEEENESEECNKVFRIEKLKSLLNLFINKKLPTLQYICLQKWKDLINKRDSMDNKKKNKLKEFIMKYPKIFAMRLLDFFDEYANLQGGIIITKNVINKKTFDMLKKNYMNNKSNNIYYNKDDKIKTAYEKLNSVLKKNVGKYIFKIFKE